MDIKEIKKILKERKITYESLSEMTSLSSSTIKKIFSETAKNPRTNTIQAIEKALGIANDTIILTEKEIKLINIFKEIPQEKQDFTITLLELISKSFK